MTNLKEIRKRRKSVLSIRKITNAMCMIAISRLNSSQKQAFLARPYEDFLDKLFINLSQDNQEIINRNLCSERKNNLFVVFSSNKGLCGGFNQNIFQVLQHSIKGKGSSSFICIGKKIFNLVSTLYKQNIIYYENIPENINLDCSKIIAERLWKNVCNKEYSSCFLIYPNFISVIKNEVLISTLFPIVSVGSEEKDKTDYEFEPNNKECLMELTKKKFISQIYRAMLETRACENSSRMIAMQNATKSADEMIRNLKKEYNYLRQSMITRDLIEIISGVEAL